MALQGCSLGPLSDSAKRGARDAGHAMGALSRHRERGGSARATAGVPIVDELRYTNLSIRLILS